MIFSWATSFAIGCFALALSFNMLRLFTAPTLTDRLLAVDAMVIHVIALLVLMGVQRGNALNFEAALLLALTGFVSTTAFCKFLLRGSVIE